MKLIVGLGNPGAKYDQSRHNVGFIAAAKTAALIAAGPAKSQFSGDVAEGRAGSEKLIVLCPQTYMNASGKSVRKAFDFYKMAPDDLLVICDCLDLPAGKLRMRPHGSAGGQKGLADIIRQLGTDQIARLRIGIDRPPPHWNVPDYVLAKIPKDQHETFETATTRAAYAAIDWATHGTAHAMNQFNAQPSTEPKTKTPPSKSNTESTKTPDQ